MEKENSTQDKVQSEKQSLDLSNMSNPKEKDFIINFLKICWRGMKYDEISKTFVPDPNGK